jgi:asparagine synthase (glutamine-hydrolysing)
MCGICGIYYPDQSVTVSHGLIKSMADTIAYRGPDAEGYYISKGIGLGHRRLSIIDLSGGAQPMSNDDGSIWVVFNGEIYNFPELRQRLEQKGYQFRTQSDTEAIVYLYQELGEAAIEQLRGMFAVAIWDARKRQLVLVRDRAGKKPLYYTYDGTRIAFASELKAILQVPNVSRELDVHALSDYFSLLYVPAPRSIFRSIQKVMPGHYLVINEHGIRDVEYWDIRFRETTGISEQEWCERLIDTYREAVRIRLMSEVPLGAFLSGGVDSSSVVALMSGMTGEPVITSSIGFEEKEFDELEYAHLVAEKFGAKHHEQVVAPDAVAIVDKLAWHYDEPFADSSAVPTYYVSKEARRHVTVALSGDGGDENFAGYRRYRFDLAEERIRGFIPAALRKALFGGIAAVYPKADWAPRWLRGKTTFENLASPHIEAYFRSVSGIAPGVKQVLVHRDVQRALGGYESIEVFRQYYDRAGTDDPLSKIQYVDVKTYLTDDILVKVDRASMANSLEVRSPILDHKLMELVSTMPSGIKLRGQTGKYIFKKALEPFLPKEILYRPKMGFAIPIEGWFRRELKDFVGDVILSVGDDGILERREINRLWNEHQKGWRNRSTELWAILMFRLWQRKIQHRAA